MSTSGVRTERSGDFARWLTKLLGLGVVARERQPGTVRWLGASVLAIGLSLLACMGIALAAGRLDPAIAGYGHLEFSDYSRLVVLGVAAACVAWRIVAAISSKARGVFLMLAIVVTVVGFAPDAWILHLGQPVAGVAALVVMHLALAVITYPALVFGAPQRGRTNRPIA